MSDPLRPYIANILDETDKVLFVEAADSAKAGAFRAAYILIWLCCAESLKRRFNAVKSRDGIATKVAGQIERIEADKKSIDMFVLGSSRDYGFLDDAGYTRLSHVYDMRCIYGHPYEKQPGEEELVAAAATVTELVLSQPVQLRHGYLSEQVRLLTEEKAFLDDRIEAVEDYAKEVVVRTDETLTEWFIEKLWSTAEEFKSDKSMALYFRRVRWFVSQFLSETDSSVFERWDLLSASTRSPIVASASLSDARIFPGLDSHVQDLVIGSLLDFAAVDSSGLLPIQALAIDNLLTDRQAERFQTAIAEVSPKVLLAAGIQLRFVVRRIIENLKSYNWYAQNPTIDALANAGFEAIGLLEPAMQFELGNNVLQSADGNSGSAMGFVNDISNDENKWPVRFIAGIVSECFINDDEQIRFKNHKLIEALLCLRTVSATDCEGIVDELVDRIERGMPKESYWHANKRKEALSAIIEVISREPDLACLSKLKHAVESIELAEEDTDE